MLLRSGEAEGSGGGAPAERPPPSRHPGQNKVLPHLEESPAVPQRLLEVLTGHFAPVSRHRGRLGSTMLLMKTGHWTEEARSVVQCADLFLSLCWKCAGSRKMHYLHFGKHKDRARDLIATPRALVERKRRKCDKQRRRTLYMSAVLLPLGHLVLMKMNVVLWQSRDLFLKMEETFQSFCWLVNSAEYRGQTEAPVPPVK